MEDNVNETTEQPNLINESNGTGILASRWKRLGASIIDGLLMMIVTIPTMYFTGGFDGILDGIKPSIGYNLMMAIFGIIVFILINGKLLINDGQTIGKFFFRIKIITLDGNLPLVNEHLLKRYAIFFIPGQIPFAGGLLSLINVLFIFGEKKRCIHDLAGGTKVVLV